MTRTPFVRLFLAALLVAGCTQGAERAASHHAGEAQQPHPHLFGAATGNQPARSDHGSQWANVRDFGADSTGLIQNQEDKLQAAIDKLWDANALASGTVNSKGGTVWIPSGTYLTGKPIWLDGEQIYLEGEGRNNTTISCLSGGPAIIMGHRRRAAWDRTVRSDEFISGAGTVTFTNGSATVTGAGTQFLTYFNALLTGAPLYIRPDADPTYYEILSVQSDTQLTLKTPYAGATTSTAQYRRGCDYLKNVPTQFAADHRVDAWNPGGQGPKLDSSMVVTSGQYFGVRGMSPAGGSPFPDHWLVFPYMVPGLGVGDCWDTIRTLTIDTCLEGKNGGSTAGYLFGFGDENNPAPWWLTAINGYYRFTFYTKEGVRNGANSPRSFTFGDATHASGVQRIALQIDFTQNTDGSTGTGALCGLRAWINGVEQTITRGYGTGLTTATSTEPSFTAGDGLHWQSAEPGGIFCFFNGASSALQWINGSYPSSRGGQTIYGFRLSNEIRYTTSGGAQVRIDGGTINDAYRYTGLSTNTSTICWLDLRTPPTADYPGRLVMMRAGPALSSQSCFGLFLFQLGGETLGGYCRDNALTSLTIKGGTYGGPVILVGACLDPTFRDLDINATNSWVGIATDVASIYDLRARDLHFDNCNGAWMALGGVIAELENLGRSATGRYALRFDGSSIKCRNVRMGDLAGTEAYIKITGTGAYGSQYVFDTVDSDNEGQPLPSLAFIYCERHNASFTSLELTNCNPGSMPAWVPMVKLVDRYSPANRTTPGPGKFHGYNLLTGHLGVQTDGSSWEGTVENIITDRAGGNLWRPHAGADGQGNVVAYHRLDGLPTGGFWQKNGQVIEVRHPSVGSTQKYLCVTSGVAGWDSSTAYYAAYNDTVYAGGTVYLATADSTNSPPPSASWTPVPGWSGTGNYAAGDQVISGGNVWMATGASFNQAPATSSAFWILEGPAAQAQFAPLATVGTPTP